MLGGWGEWKNAATDQPENGRLVLAVMPDATKEILAWHGSPPWVDQHGVERPELVPWVWHELPPPPPPPPLPFAFVTTKDESTSSMETPTGADRRTSSFQRFYDAFFRNAKEQRTWTLELEGGLVREGVAWASSFVDFANPSFFLRPENGPTYMIPFRELRGARLSGPPNQDPRPLTVVHILRYGQSMCRFSDTMPGSWPEGHIWVSFEDDEKLREADCSACRIEHGYPECPSCRVTRGGTSQSRVDRGSGGADRMKPCTSCGSATPWRTSGVNEVYWKEMRWTP